MQFSSRKLIRMYKYHYSLFLIQSFQKHLLHFWICVAEVLWPCVQAGKKRYKTFVELNCSKCIVFFCFLVLEERWFLITLHCTSRYILPADRYQISLRSLWGVANSWNNWSTTGFKLEVTAFRADLYIRCMDLAAVKHLTRQNHYWGSRSDPDSHQNRRL